MASFVARFNKPPYLTTEDVDLKAWNAATPAEVTVATPVRVFIIQDSPESRQYNMVLGPGTTFDEPKNGHYDYFMLHDAYITGNRVPTVRKMVRDDIVVRVSGERLKVTFTYDDFALAQLVWAVKLPAYEPAPTRA